MQTSARILFTRPEGEKKLSLSKMPGITREKMEVLADNFKNTLEQATALEEWNLEIKGNMPFSEVLLLLEKCDLFGNPFHVVLLHLEDEALRYKLAVEKLRKICPYLSWVMVGENLGDADLPDNVLFCPPEAEPAILGQLVRVAAARSHLVLELEEKSAESALAKENKDLHQALKKRESELEMAMAREQYLDTHDQLTSLLNKEYFTRCLAEEVARQRETKAGGLGVLFIDIDRFKNINEALNQSVGDLLLQAFSKTFREVMIECVSRAGSESKLLTGAARMGSDQFAGFVSGGKGSREVLQVANLLLEKLCEPIILAGKEIFVNLCIGISLFPNDGKDIYSLIRNAEAAMQKSQSLGMNRIAFYEPEMNCEAESRVHLEHNMRQGIAKNEFLLFFQPQVELETGKLWGFESLIRWEHPELGFLSPGQFIDIAEESGMVVPVGDWVMKTVCNQVVSWLERGLVPPPIAINVSGKQFQEPEFLAKVDAVLKRTGVPVEQIEFEVTESALVGDEKNIVHILTQLHERGIRLALDDFGTGYSSLSYLQKFPLDVLKIDQAFVSEMMLNSESKDIVRTIIELGKNLNMEVLAEGIETEECEKMLHELGCHIGQGYWFDKPLELSVVEEVLAPGDGFFPIERKKRK